MLLLFVFSAYHLTNAQQERAAVYLGRGYDVIKGNPFILRPGDGAASNQLIDPGLKSAVVFNIGSSIQNGYNMSMVNQECRTKSMIIRSMSHFHDEVLKEMFSNSEDWHEKLRANAVFGEHRTEERKHTNDKTSLYVYQKCSSNQRYVSTKLARNEANKNTSSSGGFRIEGVTDDFRRTVCELPEQYTKGDVKYDKLISTFGTSVIIGTKLGKMKIRRYQALTEAIKKHLMFGELVLRRPQTARMDQMYIRINEDLIDKIGESDDYKKYSDKTIWQIGNDVFLSPVELSLWNLDDVIHEDYWSNCIVDNKGPDENQSVDDCCTRLATLKANVKRALLDYPEKLNINFSNDTDVFFHVVWPSGTYSLFKTESGCPAETGFSWRTGFIQHAQDIDTKAMAPPMIFQSNMLQKRFKVTDRIITARHFMVHAPVVTNFLVVKQSFCTKVDRIKGDPDSQWPAGSYCVYKFGTCPQGFQDGWVFWDDIEGDNIVRRHGVYPDGVYDADTRIYFCCRKDGPASHPIILPVQEPFILMRIGGECQSVQWTKLTEASIFYDCHWTFGWHSRSHFVGGLHPDNDMDNYNNKLYYCHYQKMSL